MSPRLPEILARPPWPPARKRSLLALVPPSLEERLAWKPGEREDWAAWGGGFKPLERAEREAVLAKLEAQEIVPIGAATSLELPELVRAMQRCEKRFVEHYGIPHVALAKYGFDAFDAIVALRAKAPLCVRDALRHVDSLRVPARIGDDEEMLADWATHFPKTAALALLPAALGPEGKPRKTALKRLARLRNDGHEAAIREAAGVYGEAAVAELDALFSPEPLPSRAPTLPAFVDPASLPMPRVSGEPIGDEARLRLVQLLSLLPLGAAREAIATVRAACDVDSLGTFAAALADAWVAAGAEPKHKWALLGAGALGDDIVARKLADWTVEWARAGAHPRSAGGQVARRHSLLRRSRAALESLSLVGSDVALMHTDRIARTMKGALKTNATATIEAIAKERGLSHEELGDRLVPTLGLDPTGTTWLDFGARRFRVSFDERLVPELFDESGERIARLPRPTKDDDAERAARAVAIFKGLQSDAKKIAPEQVRRLERAMCTRRSWAWADFRRLFLEHPLTIHLARRLVWLDDDGLALRVAEDGGFADHEDREVAPKGARVRIAHPLALDRDRLAAWSTVFRDYDIVQPFAQLARERMELRDDERDAASTRRFEGRAVGGDRFFTLKHRGWGFHDSTIGKPMRGGFMAMLETDPGLEFLATRPPDQTLGELHLRRQSGGPATFGELDPIDASELLRDVELLAG